MAELADTKKSEPRWHAVLGGSGGIGLAYARHFAARGARIVIVARRPERLQWAAGQLQIAGAPEVRTAEADLSDPFSRSSLLERLEGTSYESILVGGPSPAWGRLDEVSSHDFHAAMEIALLYPIEVIRWALVEGMQRNLVIRIIGSAATREPLEGNRFFLSAVFRSTLEQVVMTLNRRAKNEGVQMRVWRPRIVLTDLSMKYARELFPGLNGDAILHSKLEEVFGCRVPTADEYVAEALRSNR